VCVCVCVDLCLQWCLCVRVCVGESGGGGSVHYITGELKKAAATCAPDFALAAAHIHPAHSQCWPPALLTLSLFYRKRKVL
jgi:hypothetical protein